MVISIWGKRESNTDLRHMALEAYLVHSLFPVSLFLFLYREERLDLIPPIGIGTSLGDSSSTTLNSAQEQI
jgi:hypothetical protein